VNLFFHFGPIVQRQRHQFFRQRIFYRHTQGWNCHFFLFGGRHADSTAGGIVVVEQVVVHNVIVVDVDAIVAIATVAIAAVSCYKGPHCHYILLRGRDSGPIVVVVVVVVVHFHEVVHYYCHSE